MFKRPEHIALCPWFKKEINLSGMLLSIPSLYQRNKQMNRNQFSILESVTSPEVKDYLLYRLLDDSRVPMRAVHWFKDTDDSIKEEVISKTLELMGITKEDLNRFVELCKTDDEAADDLYQYMQDTAVLPAEVFATVVDSVCLGHFLITDGDDFSFDNDIDASNNWDWNTFLFNLFEDIVHSLASMGEADEDEELAEVVEKRKDQPRIRVNINDL